MIMSPRKTSPILPDPFPVNKLRLLNFGSADGHRDDVAKRAFIITSSIRQFYLNQHSIVVGAIGTGKSTLFRRLKDNAAELENYRDDLIVPLEEALPFKELTEFVKEYYEGKQENIFYQLLWKFNVLLKISSKIAKLDGFPRNDFEVTINDFLRVANSADEYTNILTKIKDLMSKANLKIEAKVGDNPITFSAGLSDKDKTNSTSKKVNLEEVRRAISGALDERGIKRVTVIIDKIDRFVAGAEYRVQRAYISALLEVDDDLAAVENINLKIFIRADLFERLDFSALGYDKVQDNVIKLKWSSEETLRFLATRIVFSLQQANICRFEDLVRSSDLSEFELSWREKILFSNSAPAILKNLIRKKEKLERETSLYGKLDKAIITKLFPRKAIHFCVKQNSHEEVDLFEFIQTHFLDGNGMCTPRYMLIFLKEVVEKVASYYEENPDSAPELLSIDKDLEWDLFKKLCVYNAYVSSKWIYVKNIETVEPQWTKDFNVFLSKKGNKTKFDYKWIRANIPEITEDDAVNFLSFLQVIGYLKISDAHQDIKKRGYELPILYKVSHPNTGPHQPVSEPS